MKTQRVGSLNTHAGFGDKDDQIKLTIQENKFDIFSISETELQNFDEKKPPSFKGYKTFFPKKREGTNTKRLLVFAREDIELNQRNDLMCP